ncbi:RNB-domain-containing protein [Trametes meyenii]|nr:RNB-domain-containing protein [Trametes meyenii]
MRRVLSPEACSLLEGKRTHIQKGKQAALSSLPASGTLPLSIERLKFDAAGVEAEAASSVVEDGDPDAFADVTKRFAAGTFVEIRRNDTRAFGVVLFTTLTDRKWMVHSLINRGEMWPHQEHDVHFHVPNFVSKKLAEECGMADNICSKEESEARVEVMKRIRDFEKDFEYHLQVVLESAREMDFYSRVSHPDPTTWAPISTQEAADILLGSSTITPVEMLAVQSFLLGHGDLYVAEQRRFLQRQRFWIRPRSDVQSIRTVSKMVVDNDPAIDAFIEKARTIILAARQRATESFREPPAKYPLDGIELTKTDKMIVRFLRAALRATRHVQTDPYVVPYAQIIKKMGLYSPEVFSDSTVHEMLTEIGVLAPWEDAVTREEIRRQEDDPVTIAPTIPTALVPEPLGPEDLYAQDVAESIRHDFGDLPVYVVDDWGAEELDDGMSIEPIPSDPEHSWLHVHIADPTALLPPTHAIARKAFHMASSRYLLDRTVPMLPRDAGFHQYSLAQGSGVPEKTLTFSAKVNLTGDIVEYKVRPGIIRNVRAIKYDIIDNTLSLPSVTTTYPFLKEAPIPERPNIHTLDPATVDNLRRIHQVTRTLLAGRLRAGGLTLALPQPELELKPRPLPESLMGGSDIELHAFRGFPHLVYGIRHTIEVGARQMVSESMKTACRIASMFFRDRGIPALRRTVGPMQTERAGGIEALMATRDEDGVVDYMTGVRQVVSAPPGRYITTPGPHSLLGVPEHEGYVKVTSPLRRFGDMFAHWQIKHALLAGAGAKASPVLYAEDWLADFGEALEAGELEAKRLERLQAEYWAHLYLIRWQTDPAAARRDYDPLQHLTGTVLSPPLLNPLTKNYGCKVYVPQIALTAHLVDLTPETPIGLADEVPVKIKEGRLGSRPMLDLILA